ncbi:Hypothetical Protein FCC1311_084682 [Hondaea fermentalgiana]|uniref:J domain-containing protein n=1 Tax=Hondaea fermentalgiana TaxID=2315210 RepID=A0A2R5GUA8_9STRA|nr:Hypothetical Protein FCC1311_084682 [Hondaea fermentalgiana]|eukprot:GBG32243.1 Hypothetical Protein FCC1311_084682 [Hondaea fermentalgiana]
MGQAHTVPFVAPATGQGVDEAAVIAKARAATDVEGELSRILRVPEVSLREASCKSFWEPPAMKFARSFLIGFIESLCGNKANARTHLAEVEDLLAGAFKNNRVSRFMERVLNIDSEEAFEKVFNDSKKRAASTKVLSSHVTELKEIMTLAQATLRHKGASRISLRDREAKLANALTCLPSGSKLTQDAQIFRLRLCWRYLQTESIDKAEIYHYGRLCLDLLEECTAYEDMSHEWSSSARAPRASFELCNELSNSISSTCLDIGLLQQGIRLTTNATVRAHLCLVTTRKYNHQLVRFRAYKKFAKASAAAEHGKRILHDESLDKVGLRDEANELQKSIEEDLAFVRAQQLVWQGRRLLNEAIHDSEDLDVERLWDAIDLFNSVSDEVLEEHARALGGIAHAYQALGLFECAVKYSSQCIATSLASYPVNLRLRSWYKRCERILKERDRRNAAEAREAERRQAELDAPILKELEPELKAIKEAAEKSWADLIAHVFKAHPVQGHTVPTDLSPDNQRKALLKALLAYHPDKTERSSSRKEVLLRGRITRHLNHFYNNSKGL